MFDDEIYKECEIVWVKKTGLNWTVKEMKSLMGYLEKNEEVFLKSGELITGSQISYWHSHWMTFSYGWICAYRHLEYKR